MILNIKSTIDLTTISLEVTDQDTSRLYHVVDLALPEGITPGEYQYELIDVTGVVSRGLMMIGGTAEANEYLKTTTYEQYER